MFLSIYTKVLNGLEPAPSMALWCLWGLEKWFLMSVCKGYCTTLPTATSSISSLSPPRKPVQRFMPAPAGNSNCWSLRISPTTPSLFIHSTHTRTDTSLWRSQAKFSCELSSIISTELKNYVNMQKQWHGRCTGIQTVKILTCVFFLDFWISNTFHLWRFDDFISSEDLEKPMKNHA